MRSQTKKPLSARLAFRAEAEATWIEEATFYSLGSAGPVQWLDRWLINPILQLAAWYKTNKAFRRLQAILAKPHASVSS